MQQHIEITQGTTRRYGGSTLGLVGLNADGSIALDVWNDGEKAWLTRLRLRPGDSLAAGGHFLRAVQLQEGGPRAVLQLTEMGDAGGIAAPDAEHAVLPVNGCLEVGLTRLEFINPPLANTAQIRMWPKLYPLQDTPAEAIEERTLHVGVVLEFGHKKLQVERIQAQAGDIPGFVAFSVLQ